MRELVTDPLSDDGGQLGIGGVPALDLARRYGTPLYVIDEDRIRSNYRRLAGAFRRGYRDTAVHYAVKANTSLAVLSILRQEGAGADCAAPAEIEIALRVGFRPAEILYTAAFPSPAELDFARRAGVVVNLDSDGPLEALAREGRPPVLSFRVNPGAGRGKHGLIFAGPNAKFGLLPPRALEAFRAARSLGFERFGIHMMAGSCVLDPEYFRELTASLVEFAGEVRRSVGIGFEFVDIGGGFGVPYEPEEAALDVDRVAEEVTAAFRDGCTREGLGRPRLVLEPGRYLVGDAGVLLTTVHGRKDGDTALVGVDAGMHTLLRPALYGAYHPMLSAGALREAAAAPVHVVGPICENTDVLARNRALPPVAVGDVLAVLNAGAYGFAMSSQYNGRPRPAEVLVHCGEHELIREREGIDDLLRHQSVPERLQR